MKSRGEIWPCRSLSNLPATTPGLLASREGCAGCQRDGGHVLARDHVLPSTCEVHVRPAFRVPITTAGHVGKVNLKHHADAFPRKPPSAPLANFDICGPRHRLGDQCCLPGSPRRFALLCLPASPFRPQIALAVLFTRNPFVCALFEFFL